MIRIFMDEKNRENNTTYFLKRKCGIVVCGLWVVED
jgi:hypothetical protein